ncbi:MAG: FCD domain-containing protein, partial [Candidatus Eisenbacteria bacterium]|nr:FCD domain-containing protein [Candidatus Eisenbacteria bacterium]
VAASGHHLFASLTEGVRFAMRDPLLEQHGKRILPARARLVREHERLLNAVERGESDRVADLLADHLEGFYGP